MLNSQAPRAPHLLLASALLFGGAGGATAAEEFDRELLPSQAREYTLDGPWIYKANWRSISLTIDDFNGDGLPDIATVANDKSMLELYLQREQTGWSQESFEKTEIGLDRIVRGIVAADVNGDGRVDLVMAASPPRLAVMYQDDEGQLQPPTETDLEADGLVMGDLNNDKRPDLLIFKGGRFDILLAGTRGITLEPAQTFFTAGEPASPPMIIDFDGDGRADILYHDAKKFEDIVVRLQSPQGTFPAEFRVTSGVMRSVAPLAGTSGAASLATVQNKTRQLTQLALSESASAEGGAGELPVSELHMVPFDPETRSTKTATTVADFDGDGRRDLVVSSRDLSLLRLLNQTRDGSLSGSTVPCFEGITQVIPLGEQRGKAAPLLVFSPKEKAVGISTFDAKSGTLPFPRILPVGGEPQAVALFKSGKALNLAAAMKVGGSKDSMLFGFTIDEAGKLGERQDLLKSAEDSPFRGVDLVGMESMDFNRDGLDDLVVYVDFKPARIFLQGKDGQFEELEATSGVLQGLLASSTPGSLQPVWLKGEKGDASVLALTDKFARAFHIDGDGNVVVEEQFNGRNSRSRLGSMAVGSLRGSGAVDVALLDRGNKVVSVHGSEKDGAFKEIRHIDLKGNDFGSLRVFDLDGDGRDDIVLTGDDRIGIIYSTPRPASFQTIANAATGVEDGGYGKVFTASLIPELGEQVAVIEMRENVLEFFLPGKDADKKEALLPFHRFKVFDSDSTISRRVNLDAQPEPRELLARDLNGDGMPEIITLVHDNLIIYYPQKDGGEK